MRKTILVIFATLFALYILCFAGLGLNPLLDPDEPIYGQFVKEMVRSGDWLTPHYAGKLWFDKPPLFYWLSSLSVKALGLNEAAIRLPSALLAVLVLLGVYFLAKIDFGRRAGVLAAAVMATSLLQIIVSHAAATDETMLFCMVAALCAYRKWFDSEGRARFSWMAACGLAVGLGMLAKGPVVPLLLLVTFVSHLAWTRKLSKLWSPEIPLAVMVSALVGLPWYIAMWAIHGQVFVDQFIIGNNVSRFLHPLHKSQASHWYSHFVSIGLLLLFLFPWNVFLPSALWRCYKANVGAKLFACWTVIVMAFFSLSSTQNFTYTLPVFPACAIFIGAFLHRACESNALRKQFATATIVGCVLSLLYGFALVLIVNRKYPDAWVMGTLTAAIMLLSFLVPAVGTFTRRLSVRHASLAMAVFMVAFTGVAINGLMPLTADYLSSKPIATQINGLPAIQVATFNLWRPGLYYYLDRSLIDLRSADEIHRYAAADKPILIICDERNEQFVEQHCPTQILDCGNLDAYVNTDALARTQPDVPEGIALQSQIGEMCTKLKTTTLQPLLMCFGGDYDFCLRCGPGALGGKKLASFLSDFDTPIEPKELCPIKNARVSFLHMPR